MLEPKWLDKTVCSLSAAVSPAGGGSAAFLLFKSPDLESTTVALNPGSATFEPKMIDECIDKSCSRNVDQSVKLELLPSRPHGAACTCQSTRIPQIQRLTQQAG